VLDPVCTELERVQQQKCIVTLSSILIQHTNNYSSSMIYGTNGSDNWEDYLIDR